MEDDRQNIISKIAKSFRGVKLHTLLHNGKLLLPILNDKLLDGKALMFNPEVLQDPEVRCFISAKIKEEINTKFKDFDVFIGVSSESNTLLELLYETYEREKKIYVVDVINLILPNEHESIKNTKVLLANNVLKKGWLEECAGGVIEQLCEGNVVGAVCLIYDDCSEKASVYWKDKRNVAYVFTVNDFLRYFNLSQVEGAHNGIAKP